MKKIAYKERSYKKGNYVWMEHSLSTPYFYILKSGLLSQRLLLKSYDETVQISPGDTFGLTACLTGHSYIDSVQALQDSVIIAVHRDDLIPFLSQNKDSFYKIVSRYSTRLREVNQRLFSLCSHAAYTEHPEQIIDIAEHFKIKENWNNYLYVLSQYVKMSKNEARTAQVQKEIQQLMETKNPVMPEPHRDGSRLTYREGELIFIEQQSGDEFYLIEKGRVKISHIDRSNEFVVAVLAPGEFFGEMAILNQGVRNATATAYEPTTLLTLNKDTFMHDVGVVILQKIFASFAKRIWYSSRRAINLSYVNPLARLYDCLDLIMLTNEGRLVGESYFFAVDFAELRFMTNTTDLEDEAIRGFLNDDNIKISYDKLSINKVSKFKDTLKSYLARERTH